MADAEFPEGWRWDYMDFMWGWAWGDTAYGTSQAMQLTPFPEGFPKESSPTISTLTKPGIKVNSVIGFPLAQVPIPTETEPVPPRHLWLTGKRLRTMGIIHRASPEWKRLFKMRPTVERWFSSAKHSRLLDRHQYLGQDRVSLHARMSLLGYLLTSWGRLKAGDYTGMRADAHKAAEAACTGGGTQRDAGVRGLLPMLPARQAGGVTEQRPTSRRDVKSCSGKWPR